MLITSISIGNDLQRKICLMTERTSRKGKACLKIITQFWGYNSDTAIILGPKVICLFMLLMPLVQSCNLFMLTCNDNATDCRAEDHKSVLTSMKICEEESYLFSIEPEKYYARAFEKEKCGWDSLKDVEGAVPEGITWIVQQNATTVKCIPTGQDTCQDYIRYATKLKADGTPDATSSKTDATSNDDDKPSDTASKAGDTSNGSANTMVSISATIFVIVSVLQFFL